MNTDITLNRNRGNQASADAFQLVLPMAETLRDRVHNRLAMSEGMTCKELSAVMGLGYTTMSARLSELKKAGRIRGTGTRREGAEVVRAI